MVNLCFVKIINIISKIINIISQILLFFFVEKNGSATKDSHILQRKNNSVFAFLVSTYIRN